MARTLCKTCNGERWVCENHQNIPWGDGDGCCGGAGAPCPKCNKCDGKTPPAMPPGSKTIWDIQRGYLH